MQELTDALVGLIEQALKTQIPPILQICTVDAVQQDTRTINCTSLSGGGQYLGARLNALENSGSGFVSFPKIGSTVIVALLENNPAEAVVIMQSAVESMALDMDGNTTLNIQKDGTGELNFKSLNINFDSLTINGGNNGAMVKLPVLQSEIAKNSTFLTTLKTAIGAAPIVPADGGASFKAALFAAISSLQTANLSNVGNNKIKH